jgi:hypothetical protein
MRAMGSSANSPASYKLPTNLEAIPRQTSHGIQAVELARHKHLDKLVKQSGGYAKCELTWKKS